MAVSDEEFNALTSELQKFRENFGGMMDDTRKSRVTLEGIEKAIKEQSAAQAKARDEEDDTISFEGSDTDDMKKTLEAHRKLVEGLKEEQVEADQAEVEAKNTKNTDEMLRNQQKASTNQMKTNEYLRLLTELTNENNTRSRNREQESKSLLGRGVGLVGKGYGVAENYFDRTGAKGSQIGGGIGEMMGGARELVSIFKKGSDFFTQFGSRKRQTKISKVTKDINKEKALIAAERNRLDSMKRDGGSQEDIEALQAKISRRAQGIRERSKEFGDLTAREYMHQRSRSDKDYRKMSKYERDLLIEHSAQNITASATSDINGKVTPTAKRKAKSDQDMATRRRKNELLSESQGMSREDAIRMSAVPKPSKLSTAGGMIGGIAGGMIGGIAGLLKPKGADSSTPDRGMRLQSKSLMNTPLIPVKNPRTYGQYIAGIYQELDALNDSLGGKNKTGKVATSAGGGGGGGFFSGIMGAILGGLGSMVMGKVGKLGRFLMKPFSKLGAKAFGKIGGKGMLKFGAKGAEKNILKGGLKGAEKIGGKEALKLGGKGALKLGGKEAAKIGSKGLAKGLAKKIPGIGLIAGLGFGIDRLMDGDFLGAGGEVLSGLVSLVPVLGTAASIGIDAALVARDISKAGEEETEGLDDFESSVKSMPKSSRASVRQNDLERTRPRFQTMTTAREIEGSVGRDQMNAMQIQARLIAMEMAKIYKSDDYILAQKQTAKNQATYMKNTMVG